MPQASDKPLAHQSIVLTGQLASMRRREAERLIARAGGRTTGQVSGRTDLVVVGLAGWPVLPDGSISRKLLSAQRLREGRGRPEILSEPVFLERLGLREPRQAEPGTCTPAQAAQILGVGAAQLEHWQHFGLIRTDAEGRLPFQDLVSLRQIRELIARGVPTARLAAALESLRRVLGSERPLAQARVLLRAGDLVAELEGTRFDLAGQMELFDADPGAAADPSRQRAFDAEAWFDYAADCEEEGRWLEAEQAYLRVLEHQPALREAHFNLGNIYLARGRGEAAAEHYRAAAADPVLAPSAWYNLGYALDEQGRWEEAATALRQCLALDADYADAWFNIAGCYERLGDPRAEASWRAYLRLDRDSEWARIARRRLFLLPRAGRR